MMKQSRNRGDNSSILKVGNLNSKLLLLNFNVHDPLKLLIQRERDRERGMSEKSRKDREKRFSMSEYHLDRDDKRVMRARSTTCFNARQSGHSFVNETRNSRDARGK